MATLCCRRPGGARGRARRVVRGLGAMALGKAMGASLGSAIDQRLLGAGSAPVETGRVERFRVMGSSEGAALARVFGRARVAGQMIWSSRFLESVNEEEVGGKGGGGTTCASTAIRSASRWRSARARCCGRAHLGRRAGARPVGADASGCIAGTEDQLPDPLIAAIEGDEGAGLSRHGLRGLREPRPDALRQPDPAVQLRGVPRPAAGCPACRGRRRSTCAAWRWCRGPASMRWRPSRCTTGAAARARTSSLNVHNDRGVPDLVASLDQLAAELPNVGSVSLVVTWFGDDLRCGHCTLRPRSSRRSRTATPMPWVVSGQAREARGGEPDRGGGRSSAGRRRTPRCCRRSPG